MGLVGAVFARWQSNRHRQPRRQSDRLGISEGDSTQPAAAAAQPPAASPQPLYVELTQFTGHDGAVYAAAFSPNGKLVATGGYDKFVMIWNPDEVKPVDIAKRARRAARSQSQTICDSPATMAPFARSAFRRTVNSSSAAATTTRSASGTSRPATRSTCFAVMAARSALARSRPMVNSCSPAGRTSVFASGTWPATKKSRVLHSTVFSGHADAVLSARFSPDGKDIVTASRDRTAALWDVASGKRLKQFEEGHEFLATSAVFFSDRSTAGDRRRRQLGAHLGHRSRHAIGCAGTDRSASVRWPCRPMAIGS